MSLSIAVHANVYAVDAGHLMSCSELYGWQRTLDGWQGAFDAGPCGQPA